MTFVPHAPPKRGRKRPKTGVGAGVATYVPMAWTSDSLSKLFVGLLATGAGGCSEETGIDLARFDMDLCGEDGWQALQAVEPQEAVDYLELRRVEEVQFTEAEDPFGEPRVLDADGDKCGAASDVEACVAEFDALPVASEIVTYDGFGDLKFHDSLAYTRAETAAVLGSTDGIKSFLGDIDAPGDAALWARVQGHRIVCGEGNDVGAHADGFVLHTKNGSDGCGADVVESVILVRPDGEISVIQTVVVQEGDPNCSVGRIPDGFCRGRRSPGRNPVGRFLARVAELEAASVEAFAQFGAELSAHRAPRAFVAAAASARQDEVRHAAATRRLARRYGSGVASSPVPAAPLKGLVAMASDNAAEGCVRETFGALVAHAQARQARDPQVRRGMQTIARDETRHAALSWRVAAWARTRMGSAERARVTRSARQSVERLREELTAPLHPQVHAVLGMPEPAEAGALFGGLHAGLLRQLEA